MSESLTTGLSTTARASAIEAFPQQVEDEFLNYMNQQAHSGSCFTPQRRGQYRSILHNPNNWTPHGVELSEKEKQKVRNDKHRIKRYFSLNQEDQLVHHDNQGNLRIVACTYDAFHFVKRAHEELQHAGYHKTYNHLCRTIYGISRADVKWLVNKCQICLFNRPNKTRGPLQPIVSTHILERIQIDLIDMRHEPDGHFKWIAHIKDHYSKFSMLEALTSKQVRLYNSFTLILIYNRPLKLQQLLNGLYATTVYLILFR